jgi:hypothetical protein
VFQHDWIPPHKGEIDNRSNARERHETIARLSPQVGIGGGVQNPGSRLGRVGFAIPLYFLHLYFILACARYAELVKKR